MKTTLTCTILALVLASCGCSGIKNSMRLSEKDSAWNPVKALAEKRTKDSDEIEPAQTMAAIWSTSVYENPGLPSVRGFGGRIFFYDANSNAVPAEGELVVYCFDEESTDPSKPTRKAVFRESEFQTHKSDSGLGPSYSVWVPWDNVVGGYRKSVTLIPVFRTVDGRILKSGQSINVLDGKVRETNVGQNEPDQPYKVLGASPAVLGQGGPQDTSQVSQAGFVQTNTTVQQPQSNVRTSTIELTPNLRRQMLESQPAAGAKPKATADPAGWSAPQSAPATAEQVPTATQSETTSSTPPRVFGAPGALR